MAEPSSDSELDHGDPGEGGFGHGGPPATPRWVKVAGTIVLVLAVVVVVMLLLGHGPGQHTAGGATAGRNAPVGVAMDLFSGSGAGR